jgi:hypothetical protein
MSVRTKNGNDKYSRCRPDCKLQETLEDMFAEACSLFGNKQDIEYARFERAKEVHKLVKELISTYAVAVEWEKVGSARAYTSSVYVGPDGIRKSKDTEWRKTEVEAAPRPLPQTDAMCTLLVERQSLKIIECYCLVGSFAGKISCCFFRGILFLSWRSRRLELDA